MEILENKNRQEIKEWIDKLNEPQLLKVKEYLVYFSKTELEFKPDRVFHVDVAESIIEDGVKKWKASLAENGKHIKSYNIGSYSNSVPAEHHGILKVVEYLIEQGWKGRLLIYTDSKISLKSFYNDNLLNIFIKRGKEAIEFQKPSKKVYLIMARKLALDNEIELKLEWIKGDENQADYYSRQPLEC